MDKASEALNEETLGSAEYYFREAELTLLSADEPGVGIEYGNHLVATAAVYAQLAHYRLAADSSSQQVRVEASEWFRDGDGVPRL